MFNPSDLKQRLVGLGVAKPQDIIGCTDEEIEQLRRATGLLFPNYYVSFLRTAGKGAGRFMSDLDIFFDKLTGLNSEAVELLKLWEEDNLKLPENAFVFSMRYGEQFMFFIADGQKSDPEIYHYYEGWGTFKKVADSFWEIIEDELSILERFRKEHPDAPFWRETDSR